MTMTMISPFSGVPEQQDLTPSEGIRSFAAAATSDGLGKIRALLFGQDEGVAKKPQSSSLCLSPDEKLTQYFSFNYLRSCSS
jgi:hypothetical protein